MPLLNDQIRSDVKTMLGELPHPVIIKVFTQPFECEYCKDTRELVTEVAELNENIKIEVFDFIADEEVAAVQYRQDPCIGDYGR